MSIIYQYSCKSHLLLKEYHSSYHYILNKCYLYLIDYELELIIEYFKTKANSILGSN